VVAEVLGVLAVVGVTLGVGVPIGDGVLLDVGWVGAAESLGVGLSGIGDCEGDSSWTVSVVAHASLSLHGAPPNDTAVVVSVAPSGAPAATVAWNDVVATVLAPPVAGGGGRVQVSCVAFVSSVRPSSASSPGGVATLAFSSRPDRSSTTVAAVVSGWLLSALSLYVIVAPGATVPPDAGLAVTVTITDGAVLANELIGTNGSSQAPMARSAGTISTAPLAARRRAVRW
jgi:hypothetical protein